MTQEDLHQIRTIVREEVRAVVRAEIASNNETLSTLRTEFADGLGSAAVSFSTDFSEFRIDMGCSRTTHRPHRTAAPV